MKRLLISTTALSVALASVPPFPVMAQTVAEDGSIIAADGTILCLATDQNSCRLEDFIAPVDDAAAAAAAAEAEAAAQAERDSAAAAEAEAAAQAERDAAAAAEAEAAAQAERDAAAAAEAEAAAQAERDAAAAAEAEAAAQAERDAAAAAAAEAAAQAERDAAAAAEAAAQAERDAAAAAEAEAAAQAERDAAAAAEQAERDAAAAAEAAQSDEDPGLADALKDALDAEEQPAAPDPVADPAPETAPAPEAAPEAVTDPAAEPAPDATTQTTPPAEPVAVPEAVAEDQVEVAPPSEQAVQALTTLLAAPEVVTTEGTDGTATETPTELAAPAVAAAAALVGAVAGSESQAPVPPAELPPAPEAQAVTVQTVTEATARSSSEEFATSAREGDTRDSRKGLSNLEKAGLVALGAVAVGMIINSANKDRVVSNSGDRVVVQRGTGDYVVYKDDDALLRQPGSTVRTETFTDGSTRTIVQRPDGTQIVTIRDATGRVLRRSAYDQRGMEVLLVDDLRPETRVDISTLPPPRARTITISGSEQDALLRARMAALDAEELGRTFSLRQIREIPQVRQLAATIDVNNITFDSGSAAIKSTEAEELAALGRFITSMIRQNPGEMFLIEGHTDAVGSAASNLALSDRRAESVALALTEYFGVPPQNMIVQGYGESELRVNTQSDERQNRRVAVRIITPLMRTASN